MIYEFNCYIYELGLYNIICSSSSTYYYFDEFKDYYITFNSVNNDFGFRIQNLNNNLPKYQLIMNYNRNSIQNFFNSLVSFTTDTYGNELIKINKFGFNICQNVENNLITDFLLTRVNIDDAPNREFSGYSISPGHYRDGQIINSIYIGKYICNENYKSQNQNGDFFVDYFTARDNLSLFNTDTQHYYLFDYAMYITVWMLLTFYKIAREQLNIQQNLVMEAIDELFEKTQFQFYVDGLYRVYYPNLIPNIRNQVIYNPSQFMTKTDTNTTIVNKGIFVDLKLSTYTSNSLCRSFVLNKQEKEKAFFDIISSQNYRLGTKFFDTIKINNVQSSIKDFSFDANLLASNIGSYILTYMSPKAENNNFSTFNDNYRLYFIDFDMSTHKNSNLCYVLMMVI